MQASERANESVKLSRRNSGFDYGEVSSSARKFLTMQARRIRQRAGASVVAIGKDLLLAKRYLSHGSFLRWIASEVGIPPRTAQDYMRVAIWVEGKSATVAHLPPSILYFLSANDASDEFASQVLTRIEAGERFSRASIRKEFAEFAMSNATDALAAANTRIASPPLVNGPLDVPGGEVGTALAHAIGVMLDGLPRPLFRRVRELMTNREALANADLPDRIFNAFTAFEHLEELHYLVDRRDDRLSLQPD
jgi:DUF3102 family protein